MAADNNIALATILASLENLKARDLSVHQVEALTAWFDTIVVATATSKRHAQSLADKTIAALKDNGLNPLGVEGLEAGEWILIDSGATVVHIMLSANRELYRLEQLWQAELAEAEQ